MGNIMNIRVHPDVDSIACPGEKSAISDPITEDLVEDLQEFFGELIEVTKDPINYMMLENYFLKELSVTEDGDPDNFEVKVILDGAKINKLYPRPNEDDIISKWFSATADRKKMHLRTQEWKTVEGKATDPKELHFEINSQLHADPATKTFRVEVWGKDSEGNRRHGPFLAGFAELIWVKPLLMCRFGQKVKVRSNIQMMESGGRSTLTESMEQYFTEEELFEGILTAIKKDALDAQGEIEYKSETECVATWNQELPQVVPPGEGEGGEKPPKKFVLRQQCTTVDHKELLICMSDRILDELVMTHFYRVHKDPPRLEYWQMLPSGLRMGGGVQACMLRLRLMRLMSENDIKQEIESLTPDKDFML